ncbi:hypothetical protein [Pseudomonas sp. ACM7]|uniref:hypothetical protein n=1 Tax=Pseudomonas sp. ACM7 TaxID=2052956 RepID=UPI0010116D97|nr:hypothetical protein [Pseudomonas sp. ACM7]QAY90108.1 hypothetical protein CUN63_09275 [Pseudomonas sp. ACM7]
MDSLKVSVLLVSLGSMLCIQSLKAEDWGSCAAAWNASSAVATCGEPQRINSVPTDMVRLDDTQRCWITVKCQSGSGVPTSTSYRGSAEQVKGLQNINGNLYSDK